MSDPVAQIIGFYDYIFTFPFGFIGHTCSLLTFSSKTLRTTSTGLLFIFLALSDMLYQFMSIYDFITQVLLLKINRNASVCRFRTFIINFSTVTSAWILLLISMDRFIRACFPYRQAQICTQKIAFVSVAIIIICSIAFNSHVLQSEFSFLLPTVIICGVPRNPPRSYSIFYFEQWPIVQLLFTYFIPSCLMIVSLVSIQSKLRMQQNRVRVSTRKERMQRQILILMISSTIWFSVCTIPYSIYRVVFFKVGFNSNRLRELAILTAFLHMNYCYNFYIYCLTSTLFRDKFIEQVKKFIWYLKGQRQSRNIVLPFSTTPRTYH